MTDQSKEIPNQRGSSSGEIGQNPVEIIGKPNALAGSEPASDSQGKEEDSKSKS